MTSAWRRRLSASEAFEGVLRRGGVRPAGVEEEVEGRQEGLAVGRVHVRDVEGEVGGGFARGGVDEAEVFAVGEEANGNAQVPEEALELRRGGVAPGAREGLVLVEVDADGVAVEVQGEGEETFWERGADEGATGGLGAAAGFGALKRGGLSRPRCEGGEGVVGLRLKGAAGEGEGRSDLLLALGGVEDHLGRELVRRDQHAGGIVAEEALEEAREVPEAAGARFPLELGLEDTGDLGALLGGDLPASARAGTLKTRPSIGWARPSRTSWKRVSRSFT